MARPWADLLFFFLSAPLIRGHIATHRVAQQTHRSQVRSRAEAHGSMRLAQRVVQIRGSMSAPTAGQRRAAWPVVVGSCTDPLASCSPPAHARNSSRQSLSGVWTTLDPISLECDRSAARCVIPSARCVRMLIRMPVTSVSSRSANTRRSPATLAHSIPSPLRSHHDDSITHRWTGRSDHHSHTRTRSNAG